MTLFLIGIGLFDERDITLRGLDAIKSCHKVYLESYTSILQVGNDRLEKLYGKEIILADRAIVEQKAESTILADAKEGDVAFLVIGDPFSATTHADLVQRAKKAGIKVEIIHNASILNAVGEVGLELYKFGKTTSVPYPHEGFRPRTPYDVIKVNARIGMHTLVLLDLRPDENRFMSVGEALTYISSIEGLRQEKVLTAKTPIIGCARLGSPDPSIVYGPAGKVIEADLGKPPHCIIVPGKLHFVEEEMLERFGLE
ncbi:MAG: diphthine synthase [archaeon]